MKKSLNYSAISALIASLSLSSLSLVHADSNDRGARDNRATPVQTSAPSRNTKIKDIIKIGKSRIKSLKPGGVPGVIQVNKGVYYPGDALELRVNLRFIQDLLSDNEASLVLFGADGLTVAYPMIAFGDSILNTAQEPNNGRVLIPSLPSETLTPGIYQVALVVVKTGGDALNVSDWAHGLSSVISSTRVKIADPSLSSSNPDPEDQDGDGYVDGDEDGDGFDDDVSDIEESGAPVEDISVETPVDNTDGTVSDGIAGDTAADNTTGDTATDGTAGDTAADNTTGDTATDGTAGDTAADDTTGDTATDGTTGDTATDGTAGDTATDDTAGDTVTDGTASDTATDDTAGDTATDDTAGADATSTQ